LTIVDAVSVKAIKMQVEASKTTKMENGNETDVESQQTNGTAAADNSTDVTDVTQNGVVAVNGKCCDEIGAGEDENNLGGDKKGDNTSSDDVNDISTDLAALSVSDEIKVADENNDSDNVDEVGQKLGNISLDAANSSDKLSSQKQNGEITPESDEAAKPNDAENNSEELSKRGPMGGKPVYTNGAYQPQDPFNLMAIPGFPQNYAELQANLPMNLQPPGNYANANHHMNANQKRRPDQDDDEMIMESPKYYRPREMQPTMMNDLNMYNKPQSTVNPNVNQQLQGLYGTSMPSASAPSNIINTPKGMHCGGNVIVTSPDVKHDSMTDMMKELASLEDHYPAPPGEYNPPTREYNPPGATCHDSGTESGAELSPYPDEPAPSPPYTYPSPPSNKSDMSTDSRDSGIDGRSPGHYGMGTSPQGMGVGMGSSPPGTYAAMTPPGYAPVPSSPMAASPCPSPMTPQQMTPQQMTPPHHQMVMSPPQQVSADYLYSTANTQVSIVNVFR
jgi:hypothetical protein